MKKQLLTIAVAAMLTSGVMAANVSDDTTSKAVTSNTATTTDTTNATTSATTAKTTAPKTVKQKVPKTQTVTLDSTQIFKVTLGEEISTKTNKKGDHVPYTVAEDVMVGNVLVVPAGTTGEATISSLQKARSFGRNASMDMDFNQIQAIDGTSFPAMQGTEAQEKTKSTLKAAGASVAGVALLGPVGVVGGFFVKGKSITIPAGTEVFIQPTAPVSIVGQVPGEYEEIEVPADSSNSTDDTSTTATEATATTETAPATTNTNDMTTNSKTQSESDTDDIPTSPIVIVKRTE